MKTVEVTPLGTFEIRWGIGDPEETAGPLERLRRMKDTNVILRDPLHGEAKSFDASRLGDRVVLLCELSDGIWAVGLQVS